MQTKEAEQEAAKLDAVFPCILKIMPTCIFNKKDPIVLGVEVEEGIAKVRTCRSLLDIGEEGLAGRVFCWFAIQLQADRYAATNAG